MGYVVVQDTPLPFQSQRKKRYYKKSSTYEKAEDIGRGQSAARIAR